MLVVEDAQWLDVTSLDLLERLLRRKTSSSLLTIINARSILQTAATIGRKFEPDLLRRINKLEAPTLKSTLRQLADARLISPAPLQEDDFQFHHALIQKAAYESQTQADRQDAHRQVAEALELHYPQRTAQQPGEIARHYTAAGNAAAAIPWWLKAGRQALLVSANAEAGEHLQKGLKLIRQLPRDDTLEGLDPRITSLAYLSWVYWRQHQTDNALAASHQSLVLAQSLDNPDTMCFALGFAAMLQRFLGDTKTVADYAARIKTIADTYQLALWQGVSGMLLAWTQVYAGDEGGIAVLRACAQGIRQIMPGVAVMFVHALAEAYGFLGRFEDQLQTIDEGLQSAQIVQEGLFKAMLEDLRRKCPAV